MDTTEFCSEQAESWKEVQIQSKPFRLPVTTNQFRIMSFSKTNKQTKTWAIHFCMDKFNFSSFIHAKQKNTNLFIGRK